MNVIKKIALFAGKFRFIILIFFLVATLMISSAVIELQQSKNELFQLMSKQAHSLLESLIIASTNTLHTIAYLDDISEKRLLNNASLIKQMYEDGRINDKKLQLISRQNSIFRIHIYNKNKQKIFSSHTTVHSNQKEKHNPADLLQPIFSGEQDTLIIGYKEARYKKGHRFAVALAARYGSVIVLNVDASKMLNFKREIDFGALIRKVVQDNPEIEYIALQDTSHILAASGKVVELDGIAQSGFLMEAYTDSAFGTRNVVFQDNEVFEAVHPLSYKGEMLGLFRLGLSLKPVEDINDRIYRRLIIITFFFSLIGFVILVYIFTRQRLDILQKQYQVVETYTGNIIENVSDAIIVIDQDEGIQIFNTAAEKLFRKNRIKIQGRKLDHIFTETDCKQLLDNNARLHQLSCSVGKVKRELLISKGRFVNHQDKENIILVIRDLTDQKQLEAQLERQKRLTAMGELASGVAHEIRNPLNTIGTIIQQLDKDFEPASEQEEYHELAGLVYGEVKRINDTVQDFLRFARPEPLQPSLFRIEELLKQIEKQYNSVLSGQSINLQINLGWKGEVYWDNRQIKQVLINLIQNAAEAIGQKGNLIIDVESVSNMNVQIKFMDDGPGMSEEIRQNIFNLYFTTKASGTGIGLSIVQRIIYEHGGIVTVESKEGAGSTFLIRLPQQITGKKI